MPELPDQLSDSVKNSPLYGRDLAPVPAGERTWDKWHLAALWVGMAVCIPTYLLASYMMKSGLNWIESLLIIGLANLIITLPMVFNGHAGVKYGVPFPVIGRSAFGVYGVHIPSILRAFVACGWFGVQTWVGGLAIESIVNVIFGWESGEGVTPLKLICFMLFWFINMFFILKGTESIKWLENVSAPVLIILGILLIVWGATQGGGFSTVIEKSSQLGKPSATLEVDMSAARVRLTPLTEDAGNSPYRATEYNITVRSKDKTFAPAETGWSAIPVGAYIDILPIASPEALLDGSQSAFVQFRNPRHTSSEVELSPAGRQGSAGDKIWSYILWLTAMVGFWATMSISISDITRYARSQKDQVAGQMIGLPGTMMLFSFIGIFVTSAAVINFRDILISEDAPWDPVSLLARFKSPAVVIAAQIFMLIATLSTNIAANVIAPANAFSNLFPGAISFRTGGLITGIIGIAICPWWLMDSISGILIFISGLLGPVLGILIADYFVIRKTRIEVNQLFLTHGSFRFSGGFNLIALAAMAAGMASALAGYFIPALSFLYSLSWFTGFFISFSIYILLMRVVRNKY